jgi:hypothetical protein
MTTHPRLDTLSDRLESEGRGEDAALVALAASEIRLLNAQVSRLAEQANVAVGASRELWGSGVMISRFYDGTASPSALSPTKPDHRCVMAEGHGADQTLAEKERA